VRISIDIETAMPLKALVLSGGAEYGFAYVGAYRCLYERGLMKTVEAVYGASVGAIFATLITIGYTPREMEFVMSKLDTRSIVPTSDMDVLSLLEHCGFIEPRRLHKFLRTLIGIKMTVGDSDVTFQEHFQRSKKRLVIVGSSLYRHAPEYFSVDTFPEMPIITAIMISTAIPFVFRPIMYEGRMYVDGSFTDNFPIQYASTQFAMDEILGLYINSGKYDTPSSYVSKGSNGNEDSPLGELGPFIKDILQTVYCKMAHMRAYHHPRHHCVEMSFQSMLVENSSLFNEPAVLAEFVECGYKCMTEYLDAHPPTPTEVPPVSLPPSIYTQCRTHRGLFPLSRSPTSSE